MRLTRRVRGLALAAGILLSTALLPMRASAHYLGDSWGWSYGHHLLYLNYDNNCSPFVGIVDSSIANGWNPTSTPVWFNKVYSPGCQPLDNPVDFFTGYDGNPDVLAWAQNYERDCFISCWWDAAWDDTIEHSVIRINTNVDWASGRGFSALSDFNKQAVITHELGHSLGLAHAGLYAGEATGGYAIMDFCCFSYNTPQAHDIGDINNLYPGW